MLKFLEPVEHKPGWYPLENGHAQVAHRAKSLRTPDQYYDRKKSYLRTSFVKRRGVWWLLEMHPGMNKELIPTSLEEEAEVLVSIFLPSVGTYLSMTPRLTPEVVEELLEHLMDPVSGSNAKGRKPIGMCCLHVGDLFITGTQSSWRSSRKLSCHNSRLAMKMWMVWCSQDNMSNGPEMRKPRRNFTSFAEQSLCVSEPTEVVIPKGLKDEEKWDKDLHTAFRSHVGSINWLQPEASFSHVISFDVVLRQLPHPPWP